MKNLKSNLIPKVIIVILGILLLGFSVSSYMNDVQEVGEQFIEDKNTLCVELTGGTAGEVTDARIACQNKANHYTSLVEALKELEAQSKCDALEVKNDFCLGLIENQ